TGSSGTTEVAVVVGAGAAVVTVVAGVLLSAGAAVVAGRLVEVGAVGLGDPERAPGPHDVASSTTIPATPMTRPMG
ncbi:MAG: hypothetical protein V1249_03240, partial [Acidimicrobiales bacterium]|nr:hypothetical protein [Acidimicrobiales bacterium]